MTALAQARGVTRRYGQVVAVSGADLLVGRGEVVGLVGANGAGKTTLIRLLLGLIAPTRGTVALFGEPPSRLARRRVGYVPQGLGLYPDLTVAENRAFAAAAYGVTQRGPRPDLAAIDGEPVGELPLGARRRIAFTIATSHEPDLLVLDEPTSGVDPLGRTRLWDDIHAAAERDVGVLVTTHYMSEAEQCHRVVVMDDGHVVADGPLDDVLGDAAVVRVRMDRWERGFRVLRAAGFEVDLVGRSLHVVRSTPDAVRDALAASDLPAELDEVSASFEEAFVLLTGGS